MMCRLSFIYCAFFDVKVLLELKTWRNIFPENLLCPIMSYLDIVPIILSDFFSCLNISCGNAVELLKFIFPIGNHLRIEIKTMIQNTCTVSQVNQQTSLVIVHCVFEYFCEFFRVVGFNKFMIVIFVVDLVWQIWGIQRWNCLNRIICNPPNWTFGDVLFCKKS